MRQAPHPVWEGEAGTVRQAPFLAGRAKQGEGCGKSGRPPPWQGGCGREGAANQAGPHPGRKSEAGRVRQGGRSRGGAANEASPPQRLDTAVYRYTPDLTVHTKRSDKIKLTKQMSALPRLPDRPKRKQAGSSQSSDEASSSQYTSASPADLLRSKMATLAANPAITNLLQNPAVLQDAIATDPGLASLIASNPGMAELLRPEKLNQMLRALQDPSGPLMSSLQVAAGAGAGGATPSSSMPEGGMLAAAAAAGSEEAVGSMLAAASAGAEVGVDLSRHRMTLMQLQNYAAQMSWHGPQQSLQQPMGGVGAEGLGGAQPGGSMLGAFDRMRQLQQARLTGNLQAAGGCGNGQV